MSEAKKKRMTRIAHHILCVHFLSLSSIFMFCELCGVEFQAFHFHNTKKKQSMRLINHFFHSLTLSLTRCSVFVLSAHLFNAAICLLFFFCCHYSSLFFKKKPCKCITFRVVWFCKYTHI